MAAKGADGTWHEMSLSTEQGSLVCLLRQALEGVFLSVLYVGQENIA